MSQQPMEGTFQVRIGDEVTATTRPGDKLIEVCDRISVPLAFSCRGGACGTCAIRVIEGAENLSPRSEKEELVIEDLGEDLRDVRLACQVRVYGPAHVRAYERE